MNFYLDYFTASKDIILCSIPSITNLIFEMLVEIVNLIIIGHLNDPIALGAVGLGNMLINVICFSIAFGLNGAIDTLVSQSFGDKEYYLWGCYLNRGRIFQTILFIPEMILLLFAKPILIYFGQDEATAEMAQAYITPLLPGMFAMTQFETVRRYLQGMGIFAFPMYVQSVTMVLHFIWCYLLAYTAGLGVIGVSIATWITYWSDLTATTLYITFKEDVVPKESWHFFNSDSFKGLFEYLEYGVPSALILCLEWWSFEILSLFAGMLSVEELAANIVLLNLCIFLFQVPEGIGFVVSNLVGNSLGEMNAKKARKYVIASLGVILSATFILIILLLNLKNYVSMIFTEEQKVVDLISSTIPVFTLWVFFDYTQCVECGSLRAMGYQLYGSYASLVGYWIINLPVAYLFAFYFEYRLIGIWIGVQTGTVFTWISYTILIFRTNWDKLVQEINERIEEDKNELEVNLLDKHSI